MKVAITQRVIHADKGADRDALEQDYVAHYARYGITLIPLPNVLTDIPAHLEALGVDAIILSGGNDINPTQWGDAPDAGVRYADDRDRTERAVLEYAIRHRIPVLCECRGAQLCNVFFGGRLRRITGHVTPSHQVLLRADGLPPRSAVNSYHNWGIAAGDLAPALRAFATSDDDLVEGFSHPDFPIAGILWHPERVSPDPDLNERLVRMFVDREGFWR